MTLGETLRAARKEADLTQAQLAAALACNQQFIHQIESGRRPLPREMIPRLPKAIRKAVIAREIAELKGMASDD